MREPIKENYFTRVNNDSNGNPRYVLHFLHCVPAYMDNDGNSVGRKYDAALYVMKKAGGRKFHNKQYGGGIVFSSYDLTDTIAKIERVLGEVKP